MTVGTQTIGLFEAKTHLSELVAKAESGDEVIITRHSRPVARLVGMNRALATQADARRAAIDALAAFDPIDVRAASVEDLVRKGRR